jgi:hypothetical protein
MSCSKEDPNMERVNNQNLSITSLKIENSIDTLVISNTHKYIIKGIYTNGSSIDLSNSVDVSSSSKGINVLNDKKITGAQSGNHKVTIMYNNLKIDDDVYINNFDFI